MSCIFCSIAAGTARGHVLWSDQDVLVILSLEAHPLVLPRRHLAALDDLDETTGAAMIQAAAKAARALRVETGCEGVNLVLSDGTVAGQDVFHLHLHVKPRWKDDGVVLSWDTTPASDSERARLAAALAARLAGTRR